MQNSLKNKRVAVFGANGGLGTEICKNVIESGGDLVAIVRSGEKAKQLEEKIKKDYPQATLTCLFCDLSDISSVDSLCNRLIDLDVDILVHNAGAYAIPRHKCSTGYDNVFTINFISPYYITKCLIPTLEKNGGRVVAVGSIAHNYNKCDFTDVDFSTRKKSSHAYGNAKRYLMYALSELSKHCPDVSFSVTHPGITFTNITAHYPPFIFAIIKHPMKVIFPPPKKAVGSIIEGLFTSTEPNSWIGPRIFNVWGKPKKQPLKTATQKEIDGMFNTAEKIYKQIKNNP